MSSLRAVQEEIQRTCFNAVRTHFNIDVEDEKDIAAQVDNAACDVILAAWFNLGMYDGMTFQQGVYARFVRIVCTETYQRTLVDSRPCSREIQAA